MRLKIPFIVLSLFVLALGVFFFSREEPEFAGDKTAESEPSAAQNKKPSFLSGFFGNDEPDQDPDSGTSVTAPASASPLKKTLTDTLTAANSDQAAYEKSLNELQKNPELALPLIEEDYQAADVGDFNKRWLLIEIASQLKTPAAIPLFDEVLATPYHDFKQSPEDKHQNPSDNQEETIRYAAIRGLKVLSKQGNGEAKQALNVIAATHSSRGVRSQALLAYLDSADDPIIAREELTEQLAPEDQSLLEIKQVSAAEIAQWNNDEPLNQPEPSDTDHSEGYNP